ncbi:hypothetical protein A2U01_0071585, partial [Trifolium medium]|nr:hypothetical protein [Trifolium medium]
MYEGPPEEVPLNQTLKRPGKNILTSPYWTSTREVAPPTRKGSRGYHDFYLET